MAVVVKEIWCMSGLEESRGLCGMVVREDRSWAVWRTGLPYFPKSQAGMCLDTYKVCMLAWSVCTASLNSLPLCQDGTCWFLL